MMLTLENICQHEHITGGHICIVEHIPAIRSIFQQNSHASGFSTSQESKAIKGIAWGIVDSLGSGRKFEVKQGTFDHK